MATTLTARSPEDLLAVVPVVLGFVPERSVVMLTFGAVRGFHARVDLPAAAEELPEVVAALLGPARRHRVRRVVFLIYAPGPDPAHAVSRALVRAFRAVRIEVVDVLRADGRRWYPMLRHRPGVPAWGVPYDVRSHPFAVQSVLDGRVTHGSRDELAASLGSDPGRVRAVAGAVARRPPGRPRPAREEAWARDTVRRHVRGGTSPGDDEAARLLVGLRDLRVRDAAWSLMTRADARPHVEFWADLVRRAPPEWLAAPAALLAFAAWLAGEGALAWCALDRCRDADPRYRLADQLARMLAHAVPPHEWEADDPG